MAVGEILGDMSRTRIVLIGAFVVLALPSNIIHIQRAIFFVLMASLGWRLGTGAWPSVAYAMSVLAKVRRVFKQEGQESPGALSFRRLELEAWSRGKKLHADRNGKPVYWTEVRWPAGRNIQVRWPAARNIQAAFRTAAHEASHPSKKVHE